MADASKSPDPFDVRTIRHLVNLMARHDLSEIDLRQGDHRIRLRRGQRTRALPPPLPDMMATRDASPPAPTPAPTETAAAPAAHLQEIKSPTVGTFYAAPNPDAPPYVTVGARVTPTTVVCNIEAMKIFNEIMAECSGVIKEILVENKEPVEYGTVLFRVDPHGWSDPPMFQRILVANRGEIALRIIRACRDLGLEVVAVYSEADRGAPYLALADEAICIGPAPSAESYLNIPRLISAAEIGGVQAIHPGYGFLSENAKFAEICRECKFEFIGPAPEAMDRLGNKNQARKLAQQAGVPVVPGSEGLLEGEDDALSLARSMGFPVLIKAAAGGGGRGMRVARDEAALRSGVSSARQEAEKAFKDGSLYLEKYIEQPRHVEVQLLGDRHGNMIHLWERDCSLQRRHQKLVEESPAPHLPESVRRAMCDAAVRLARMAGYYSAGTCEFLVDRDNRYYFIEVNARIQVEHPVTELVTGIDLVKEQIRIAAGEPLSFGQEAVVQRGCAIECRINAEDPSAGFRPSPGLITRWQPAGGPGVRIDTHVVPGYRVPPNYDSLVCKLLVHRSNRTEALATMRRALAEFTVEGIHTTIPLLKEIFRHSAFLSGQVDTTFIERTFQKA